MPNISIDKSISRLQSAVACGRCGRRIENTQSARRGKREVFSISPYEKMASPVKTSRPTAVRGAAWQPPLQQHGFAGTGHTLLRRHKAAFPTKGWLRRNGTYLAAQAQGCVPYERMASLERGIPCCAGTGCVPYAKLSK